MIFVLFPFFSWWAILFDFLRESLACRPGWNAFFAHCNLCLLGSSDSPASAFLATGITGICHHSWLIFVFLVETGVCHVGQAGLELLSSGDLPFSASQSTGITGIELPCPAKKKKNLLYLPSFLCFWCSVFPNIDSLFLFGFCFYFETGSQLGVVFHACNPSTLGGQGRWITWGQEFETSWPTWWNPVLKRKERKVEVTMIISALFAIVKNWEKLQMSIQGVGNLKVDIQTMEHNAVAKLMN